MNLASVPDCSGGKGVNQPRGKGPSTPSEIRTNAKIKGSKNNDVENSEKEQKQVYNANALKKDTIILCEF
jgi:hypothetical protein